MSNFKDYTEICGGINSSTSFIGWTWEKTVLWANKNKLEYVCEEELPVGSALVFDDFVIVGKPKNKVFSVSSRKHWSNKTELNASKVRSSYKLLFKSSPYEFDNINKVILEKFEAKGDNSSEKIIEFHLNNKTNVVVVFQGNQCVYFKLENRLYF